MKIVVTGSSGFLGATLLKGLIKHDYNDILDLTSADCDISAGKCLKLIMRANQPDVIYHLAAIPQSKPSDPDPNRIIDVNIRGTHNILRFMKPGSKIVFASSIVVYGDKNIAQNEWDDHRDCTSVYAATKVACEELIKAHSVINDIDYTICRLSAMVGPNMTHGLVKIIMEKLQTTNTYIELLGDRPGSVKPYTHVQDVVDKMIEIPLNPLIQHNRILNMCTSDPISVEDVALTIMDEIDIHKEIRWLGDVANWKGDNKLLWADNSLCKKLSSTGFLDSRSAIRKAINDIRSN